MKWYDVRFWKWVSYISAIGIVLLLLYGCRTPRTITKQTCIKDCSSDKRFDSLFTARMAYTFDQWLHYQKRERERSTKDSSYIKDSTATRLDAQGNKIGEDRFHYESHIRTEKDVQKLLDSISHYRLLKDSVSFYRHKLDSILRNKHSSESEVKMVEKSLSTIQKIYIQIGQLFCLCVVIVMLYLLYIFRKRHS